MEEFIELTEQQKADVNLIRMKSYATQYLEAVNMHSSKEILEHFDENYQHVRKRAEKFGADVSKLPKTLKELLD